MYNKSIDFEFVWETAYLEKDMQRNYQGRSQHWFCEIRVHLVFICLIVKNA